MAQARLGRPPGKSEENTARRRRQLLEAAIDCIVTHGFAATTLAKVSNAAGLSQGMAVFYFKTKELLLEETLRYHYASYQRVWQRALDDAPDDPVGRILAFVLADLDPEICNPRNTALWASFWGEAGARPHFAKICDDYDHTRNDVLKGLCREAEDLIAGPGWTVGEIVDTLDSVTDGMWVRFHISPDSMTAAEARTLIARLLATIFPRCAAEIFATVEKINRDLAPT
ncbi:MAG TPA: TetR/AcrR family transcriptional regulator [Kiloniellaceae bacterium]|nr:TetR/AcrR family transcriptional regulator [Kiloniellaceae bacterium]